MSPVAVSGDNVTLSKRVFSAQSGVTCFVHRQIPQISIGEMLLPEAQVSVVKGSLYAGRMGDCFRFVSCGDLVVEDTLAQGGQEGYAPIGSRAR
jgi:hypothetical protein